MLSDDLICILSGQGQCARKDGSDFTFQVDLIHAVDQMDGFLVSDSLVDIALTSSASTRFGSGPYPTLSVLLLELSLLERKLFTRL